MDSTTNSSYLTRPQPQVSDVPVSSLAMMAMLSNPEDPFIEPKLDALIFSLTVISGVVVSLRIYQKQARGFGLWWDDYTAIVSCTLLVVIAVALSLKIHIGAGRPAAEALEATTLRTFRLAGDVASTIALAATSLAKTGLAAALLRRRRRSPAPTSAVAGGWWPNAAPVWVVVGLMNAASGAAGVLVWARCAWGPPPPPLPLSQENLFEGASSGSCIPGPVSVGVQIVSAAVSGATDIALSLLALYVVRKSTENQGSWSGGSACAILGVFAGLVGLTKSAVMRVVDEDYLTSNTVIIMICDVVEPSTMMVAASLPELRGCIWGHSEPSGHDAEDLQVLHRQALTGTEYDFVREQYAATGSNASRHRSTESMGVVDVRQSAFWV